MTEEELVLFLRIPNVRPRIQICGKALIPRQEIIEWIRQKTTSGKY